MNDYGLMYSDGRIEDIVADNDRDAVRAVLARFGVGAVIAEQWDADDMTDTDEPYERLLIWEDAERHAVAELFAPAERDGERYPY